LLVVAVALVVKRVNTEVAAVALVASSPEL
jgi:hypothetical protein